MSRSAEITLTFGDGEYVFRLPLKQAEELQESTGVGIAVLFTRMAREEWRAGDIRQVIRLGLIGGGMPPDRALAMVKNYVDGRPYAECLATAIEVLHAAVIGTDQEPMPGKDAASTSSQETGEA